MPGGDVSTLTLRRVKLLADEAKRDRLAVAALVAGLFPSTQQALDRLEAVLAAPDPPAGRTRRDKHVRQLSDDTRMWLREIEAPLQVMAAAETARREAEEGANSKLGSDAKAGSGDSSPAPEPGASERDTLIRRAISDPGAFVARVMEWDEPRWEGDRPGVEPLHVWQARAVTQAIELAEIDEGRAWTHLMAWMDLAVSNLHPWPEVRRLNPRMVSRSLKLLGRE